MAVKIEIPYEGTVSVPTPPDKAFAYLADLEKSIPGNFPGVASFQAQGADTYQWAFEKVGYSGYELEIQLVTQAKKEAPSKITLKSVPGKGTALFDGSWALSPKGSGTQIAFQGKLQLELPIPGFLKGMATPLAEKEIRKLFDRYLRHVEKNLG
ncbi:SRPBCC family protein [bacterium]|nr:SRPBCC family protein [bacterium]